VYIYIYIARLSPQPMLLQGAHFLFIFIEIIRLFIFIGPPFSVPSDPQIEGGSTGTNEYAIGCMTNGDGDVDNMNQNNDNDCERKRGDAATIETAKDAYWSEHERVLLRLAASVVVSGLGLPSVQSSDTELSAVLDDGEREFADILVCWWKWISSGDASVSEIVVLQRRMFKLKEKFHESWFLLVLLAGDYVRAAGYGVDSKVDAPPYCAMCQRDLTLVRSHLIPHFVWRQFLIGTKKEVNMTRMGVDSSGNPGVRQLKRLQYVDNCGNGMPASDATVKLLCKDCEDQLSKWESKVAKSLRDKSHISGSVMNNFAASVLWRMALTLNWRLLSNLHKGTTLLILSKFSKPTYAVSVGEFFVSLPEVEAVEHPCVEVVVHHFTQ